MAHGITKNDGAAYAVQPAWHGLGTVVDHAMNSEEALSIANLNWEVRKVPLVLAGTGQEVPDRVATCRVNTDDSLTILGDVSSSYQVIQNIEAFRFLDSFVQDGILKYEAAFSMHGGKKICIAARMPSTDYDVANGDPIKNYLIFSNGHDGRTRLHVLLSAVRTVCENTQTLAVQGIEGFKHTAKIVSKMDTMKKYLSQFDSQFTLFRDKAQRLVNITYDENKIKSYVDTLFPPETEEGNAMTRREKQVAKIMAALEGSAQNIPSIRGTMWGLYNAVTEVTDHDHKVMDDAKQGRHVESILWGAKADFKSQALELALTYA